MACFLPWSHILQQHVKGRRTFMPGSQAQQTGLFEVAARAVVPRQDVQEQRACSAAAAQHWSLSQTYSSARRLLCLDLTASCRCKGFTGPEIRKLPNPVPCCLWRRAQASSCK